jgi:DNA-binding NarL/FixJ family response regulator
MLVCDDHAVFRAGLRLVLQAIDEDVELLEAADGSEALRLADAHPDLDLVLLDLEMPGIDGRTGLRRLREAHPEIPVVIVSAAEDGVQMRDAIEAGASGYVPKGLPERAMRAALQLVLAGGVFVPRGALSAPPPESTSDTESRRERRRARVAGLTPRQREVLQLMVRGLTNREICGVLAIAEGTVKAHVAAIFDALDVSNRTEAALIAREIDIE